METEAATEKKQIDWQIPNDNQEVTIANFRKMVENGENAPHISFNEFVKVTNEWLNK
jgi:hypothetical protein